MARLYKTWQKLARLPSLTGAISSQMFFDRKNGSAMFVYRDHWAGTEVNWRLKTKNKLILNRWRLIGAIPMAMHVSPPGLNKRVRIIIVVDRSVDIKEGTYIDGSKSSSGLANFQRDQAFTKLLIKKPPMSFMGKTFPDNSMTMPVTSDSNRNFDFNKSHSSQHKTNVTRSKPSSFKPHFSTHDELDLAPIVEIIRVQSPSDMPSIDQPHRFTSAPGIPHVYLPKNKEVVLYSPEKNLKIFKEKLIKAKGKAAGLGVLILPAPHGVTFIKLRGDYTLSINVENIYKPAAYAYVNYFKSAVSVCLIQHSKNVRVKLDVHDKALLPHKTIHVFVQDKRGSIDHVAYQDTDLTFAKSLYKRIPVKDPVLEKFKLITGILADVAISFIPVVGIIYELGQMSYMMATGKDFWGNEATAGDIILAGSLSALSVAVSGRQALKGLERAAESHPIEGLENIFSEPVRNAVARNIDQADDVHQAVKTVDKAKKSGESSAVLALTVAPKNLQDRFAASVKQLMIGQGTINDVAKTLTRVFRNAASRSDVADILTTIKIKELMTADLKHLRHPLLKHEYNEYTKRFNKAQSAASLNKNPASPEDWLLRRPHKKVVQDYMKALFDIQDYPKLRKLLRSRIYADSIFPSLTLTKQHIAMYDKLQKLGLDLYSKFYNQSKKLKSFGKFFEIDHVVEQRFFDKSIQWTDQSPSKYNLLSFVIPRTEAVAMEMVTKHNSRLIKYVHVEKTRMMKQLIPHGSEHLFSVQEIMDATAFTLRRLEVDYIDLRKLEVDFKTLAKEARKLNAKQISDLRMPDELKITEDLFDPASKFPRVEKVNGQWVKVN